jgi:hypothetical protein
MELDTMTWLERLPENISNLLVKPKEDFHHVLEDFLTMKPKLISTLSQSSKPNLEMEQVPPSKQENTIELLVLVKPISMR